MNLFKNLTAVPAVTLLAAALLFPSAKAEDSRGSNTDVEIARLRAQVEALTQMVGELQKKVAEKTDARAQPAPSDEEPALFTDLQAAPDAAAIPEPKRTDLSIFNPEISAMVDFVGSYSKNARNLNFIARSAEVMIQSNVDQWARAVVVLSAESELEPWAKSDPFDEVSFGLEEAYIATNSLPYGLEAKAGAFMADFSRLGKVHTHELPFIDRPASLSEVIGDEALSHGIELNWIPPLGHYMRFTAGVVDNIGAENSSTDRLVLLSGDDAGLFEEAGHRSFGELLYYTRAATVFELSDALRLNTGVNYARGGDRGDRELLGGDFKLTWQPDPARYDNFIVGGELLRGESDGALSADALFIGGPNHGSARATGGYLYTQYNRGKFWETTLRYDWLRSDQWSQTDSAGLGVPDGVIRESNTQQTFSAYLGYKFSEFNRLRFGIAYIDGDGPNGKNNDWLSFLQWSVTLGPHRHDYQP